MYNKKSITSDMIQICKGLYSILFLFIIYIYLDSLLLNKLFHNNLIWNLSWKRVMLGIRSFRIIFFFFSVLSLTGAVIPSWLNNFRFHLRIEYEDVIYARNSIIRSLHFCDVEIGGKKKKKITWRQDVELVCIKCEYDKLSLSIFIVITSF